MKFLNAVLITLSITFTGIVNAGIITFSIDETVTQGVGVSDFSGPGGSVGGVIDGFNLILDPGASNNFLDLQFVGGEFFVLPASSDSLDALSAGSVISDATFISGGVNQWAYALFSGSLTADFTTSFTDMFLGFKTGNGKYGYIEVDWTFSEGKGTLHLGNGAYENIAGVAITTPSVDVPEPSTLAIFALGMVGLVSRRFKKQ